MWKEMGLSRVDSNWNGERKSVLHSCICQFVAKAVPERGYSWVKPSSEVKAISQWDKAAVIPKEVHGPRSCEMGVFNSIHYSCMNVHVCSVVSNS